MIHYNQCTRTHTDQWCN